MKKTWKKKKKRQVRRKRKKMKISSEKKCNKDIKIKLKITEKTE